MHQCHNGHCHCIDCWRALDPRICPVCNEPIHLDINRNLTHERAIAALEAAGPSAAFTRTGVQAGLDEEVLLRNRRRAAEPVVDD